jgi:hypothetical protein
MSRLHKQPLPPYFWPLLLRAARNLFSLSVAVMVDGKLSASPCAIIFFDKC